jgi:hypothetical protein
MDVGDLPVDEATDEDVRRLTHGACQPENLFALRVTPPASLDPSADHYLGQIRYTSPRALEHDAMAFDECEK